MPEGDTVYLEARNLHAALAGETLTRCEIRVPAFATVDLTGRRLDSVVSRGKHLLMRIGEYSIHSHLKMEGSWHLYRPETPWRRPAWEARAILGTTEWTTVGFALGKLEVLPLNSESEAVGHLGPDLLGEDWDAAEAARRLRQHPEVPVCVAVLDQRNLAGIGNVYANELCFLRGLAPTLPVGDVADVDGLVTLAHRLLEANKNRSVRSTTGDLRTGQTSWVYGRAGKPCRRCGTKILAGKLGASQQTERDTYWCPSCQPLSSPHQHPHLFRNA